MTVLGWTTWTAYQSREQPVARSYIALLGSLTLWALFALVGELPVLSSGHYISSVWPVGQFAVALFVPALWTLYTLGYTGRGSGLTAWRSLMLAAIAVPLLGSGVVIGIGPPEGVAEPILAWLLGTAILTAFGLFVYGTYLLVGLSRQHVRVSAGQVSVLTGGIAVPYLVGLSVDSSTVSGSALGLLVSGVLFTVALRRYPVMTGFPKSDYVARSRVVEALQEAVIVLDWEDHVLDANETTARLFDIPSSTLIGEPLESVAEGFRGVGLTTGTTGTVTLQTTKGRRRFQYSVSAVDGAGPASENDRSPVARALLLRDVTDQQTRDQRLTVLNRVLRHNVRNKLDVVLAHAELVDDDELQRGIQENASDLLDRSNKAREAEQLMTDSLESPEPVDIAGVTREVVDKFTSEHPESTITLAAPDRLTISSHRTVVREVLAELIDNALAHTETAEPTVRVTVSEGTEAAARISVADEGPGIPERERRILHNGTETQLEHGQGIGLWFVNWAVTQLGGDLSFAENDPKGSVVTVRLYDTEY